MFWHNVVEGIGWTIGGFVGLLIIIVIVVLGYILYEKIK